MVATDDLPVADCNRCDPNVGKPDAFHSGKDRVGRGSIRETPFGQNLRPRRVSFLTRDSPSSIQPENTIPHRPRLGTVPMGTLGSTVGNSYFLAQYSKPLNLKATKLNENYFAPKKPSTSDESYLDGDIPKTPLGGLQKMDKMALRRTQSNHHLKHNANRAPYKSAFTHFESISKQNSSKSQSPSIPCIIEESESVEKDLNHTNTSYDKIIQSKLHPNTSQIPMSRTTYLTNHIKPIQNNPNLPHLISLNNTTISNVTNGTSNENVFTSVLGRRFSTPQAQFHTSYDGQQQHQMLQNVSNRRMSHPANNSSQKSRSISRTSTPTSEVDSDSSNTANLSRKSTDHTSQLFYELESRLQVHRTNGTAQMAPVNRSQRLTPTYENLAKRPRNY